MHLKWNSTERRFEAELGSGGFRADLEAVKAAGFKTDGADSGWIWYSLKAMPLKWLRENRPPILTITTEARVEYERLLPVEENNARLKAELDVHKKALKKTLDAEKRQSSKKALVIPEKGYIDAEDLPPFPPSEKKYVAPPPPTTLCFICYSPIYPYEYSEGTENPACLWCQKKVLDISDEVC